MSRSDAARRRWEKVPEADRRARMKAGPVSSRLFGYLRLRVERWMTSEYATAEQRRELADLLLSTDEESSDLAG